MFQQFGFIEILTIAGFLILLLGFIVLFRLAGILKNANGKPAAVKNENSTAIKSNNAQNKAQPFQNQTVAKTADHTLIVVLTAAVAAYLGTSPNGLHIKSYRRLKSGKPSWRKAGRTENLNNHY